VRTRASRRRNQSCGSSGGAPGEAARGTAVRGIRFKCMVDDPSASASAAVFRRAPRRGKLEPGVRTSFEPAARRPPRQGQRVSRPIGRRKDRVARRALGPVKGQEGQARAVGPTRPARGLGLTPAAVHRNVPRPVARCPTSAAMFLGRPYPRLVPHLDRNGYRGFSGPASAPWPKSRTDPHRIRPAGIRDQGGSA